MTAARRELRLLLVATIAATLPSCQYDPYTESYARTRPVESALLGVWTPTAETSHALALGPYRRLKPRIEVRPDGTISV